MKIKYYKFAVLLFFVACASDKDNILEILKKAHNSAEYKMEFEMTGAQGGYGILKKGTLLKILSRRDTTMEKAYEEQKRQIDDLVFHKLVEFHLLKDDTGKNAIGDKVNQQEYSLTLTDEGKKLLVGETTDKFIFNIYDLDDIRIMKEPYMKNDTTFVEYTINQISKTKAFGCLRDYFQKNPNTSVMLSTQLQKGEYKLIAKFVKTGNDLRLVEFQK